MDLCLEEAGGLAVVERRAGRTSTIQPSGEEVIGPLRLGAFTSPGSPLGLRSVFDFSRNINNPGYASEDHSALWRQGAMRRSRRLIKLKLTRPMTASKITVTNSLGLSQVSEESRKR